jgi:hypothetical protein
MDNSDFLKNIDFSSLENLGLDKEEGIKFLGALAPIIDLEFQSRIDSAFSGEEIDKIGEEALSKDIKPEDGTFFLEQKFYEKTGKYFLDEMKIIFNEYIVHSANVISMAKKDAEKFGGSGNENMQKFNALVENKNWTEAAKIFEKVVDTSKQS